MIPEARYEAQFVPRSPLDQITVVLHRPQEAVNVGAVVRAMKNMGITDLRLVQPATFEAGEILRLAHRCEDLLARMTVYEDLDAALAEMTFVIGTAAISHHKRPLTQDVRGVAATVVTHTTQGRVALLFGQEDDGLDNHALDRCHLLAMLPSDPAYPALNLAQSVLLFLYEIRMATSKLGTRELGASKLGASDLAASYGSPIPASPGAELATHSELEQLHRLSEEALTAIGFFRYNPEVVMRTLRQITQRATLSKDDIKLLMAIVRKIAKS